MRADLHDVADLDPAVLAAVDGDEGLVGVDRRGHRTTWRGLTTTIERIADR